MEFKTITLKNSHKLSMHFPALLLYAKHPLSSTQTQYSSNN